MAERSPISRRRVFAPLVGIATLPFVHAPAAAEVLDNPPVFRTARRQFTIAQPPKTLPQVPLTGLDGRTARLAPTPGRILLINLWATWCDACRLELPMMERLHASGTGVNVAAVSTEKKDRREIADFLARLSVRSLPILLDPEERLASASPTSTAPLGVYGMPVTYLVTPSGRIAGFIEGVAEWASEDGRRLLAYYAKA